VRRYLLFAWDSPRGGADDFVDSFDDVDPAIAAGQATTDLHWNVLDAAFGRVVAAGNNAHDRRTPQ
jgi:hypothetical protein